MAGTLKTLEAVTGTPLLPSSVAAEMGIQPSMFKRIRQRADQRRAQDEAKSKSKGVSVTSKILKSIGGTYQGPIGMAEPWVEGNHPGFNAGRGAGMGGVYGQAGAEADARVAALQGMRQPGYVRATTNVGGMIPISGAGQGLVGESGGISPLGAGKLGLETAMAALGLTLASPAEFAAGTVGSTGAREYTRAVRPNDRRAQFYAGIGGGLAGGIAGGALTPESWSPSRTAFGDVLDKVVNSPGAFIRPAGTGLAATLGRSAVNALPSTGSVSSDLLGRLQALRRVKANELLARAYNPLRSIPGAMPQSTNPYAENPYA